MNGTSLIFILAAPLAVCVLLAYSKPFFAYTAVAISVIIAGVDIAGVFIYWSEDWALAAISLITGLIFTRMAIQMMGAANYGLMIRLMVRQDPSEPLCGIASIAQGGKTIETSHRLSAPQYTPQGSNISDS